MGFLRGITLLAGLIFVSSGCAGQSTPYRPPTIVFKATAPALETPTVPSEPRSSQIAAPLATPVCTDGLTFLEDVTLPDGTIVTPGASLDKRWLIQNSGTCNWDERYRLKLVSGTDLGAPLDQALYPARSGIKATLRLNLTSPTEPGTYQTEWQAYNPQGQAFGDPIFLQVVVAATAP